MTDTTGPPPVPTPVTWAMNIWRKETDRASAIADALDSLDRREAEARAYLAALESDRARARADHHDAVTNAETAREMAEAVCTAHGWTMPPLPEHAPGVDTATFAAIPEGEAVPEPPADETRPDASEVATDE